MRYLIAAATLLASAVWAAWPAAAEPPSCAGLGGTIVVAQTCRVHASGADVHPQYERSRRTIPTGRP